MKLKDQARNWLLFLRVGEVERFFEGLRLGAFDLVLVCW